MVLISLAKLLLIYNIVHAYINTLLLVIFKYRTAENFQGRKLSRILRFCAYSRKFSLQNLGAWCPLARHERAICESFLCKKRIFTNLQKFSPSKVSRYTVFFDSLSCMCNHHCLWLPAGEDHTDGIHLLQSQSHLQSSQQVTTASTMFKRR